MAFSCLISAVTKHKKLILFINLDAKFHILKLLFEDFLPKIIRGAVNIESLILRAKFLCLKFDGTHGRAVRPATRAVQPGLERLTPRG